MGNKLTLGTAKWLFEGAKALLANPELKEWSGLKRTELLWLITDITGEEVIAEAVAKLEKIVAGDLPPTVPPELNELIAKLDEYQENQQKGQQITEEQIRQLRISIINAQLDQQRKGDLYVAPDSQTTREPENQTAGVSEDQSSGISGSPVSDSPKTDTPIPDEPIPYRRPLPQRPPAPAPVAQKPSPTPPIIPKVVFLVKKGILHRLAETPTHALRTAIAVGEEAVGKGPSVQQKAYAAKFLSQGITSTSLHQAIEEYRKGSPGELGVIQALKDQANVLADIEKQNPTILRLSREIYSPQRTQVAITNQPAPREQGRVVENYRALIDLLKGQVASVEYWEPGQVGVAVTQEVEAPRRSFADRAIETAQRVNDARLAAKGARAAAPLLRGALQGLGGILGGAAKIGAGIAGVSGGTAAAGGAATAGGVAAATAPAWIPIALIAGVVIFLIVGVGFINNTHQSAYLGEQIVIEESPFIGVSKTASKTSFRNDELPQDVTFTITVIAKQGKLTNAKVTDSFNVSGTGTASLPQKSWDAGDIETSWAQDFQVTFPATLKDNLVINYVTVTAEVENQPAQTATTSLALIVGNPPQDCPLVWPIQPPGQIKQGPHGSYSHQRVEAIDIYKSKGAPVTATHKGIVKVVEERGRPSYCPAPTEKGGSKWNDPGVAVVIQGMCNGKAFTSRYAHLEPNTRRVLDGQQVTAGTQLGTMGESGCANSPHLHYQFGDSRGVGSLEMKPLNIPKSVPRGCLDGTSNPCNVNIP